MARGRAKWSSLFSLWEGGYFCPCSIRVQSFLFPPSFCHHSRGCTYHRHPPILKCLSSGSGHKGVLVFILFVCSGPVSLSHKAGHIRESCSALNGTRGGLPRRRRGTSLTERCSHRVGWSSAEEGGRDSRGGARAGPQFTGAEVGCRVVSKPRGLCEAHINHSRFGGNSYERKGVATGGVCSSHCCCSCPFPLVCLSLHLPLSLSRSPSLCQSLSGHLPRPKHGKKWNTQAGISPNKKAAESFFKRSLHVSARMSVRDREMSRVPLFVLFGGFFFHFGRAAYLSFQILEAGLQTQSSALSIIKEVSQNSTCDLSLKISANAKNCTAIVHIHHMYMH